MDEATRRHRAGAVPEEQDGDLSSDGSKMADADELVFVHARRLSNSRATPPASQLAPPARILAIPSNSPLPRRFPSAGNWAKGRLLARVRAGCTHPYRARILAAGSIPGPWVRNPR